jgi:hypothetical protein
MQNDDRKIAETFLLLPWLPVPTHMRPTVDGYWIKRRSPKALTEIKIGLGFIIHLNLWTEDFPSW